MSRFFVLSVTFNQRFDCPQFDTFQVPSMSTLGLAAPPTWKRIGDIVTDMRRDQLTLNLAEGSTGAKVCMGCKQALRSLQMFSHVYRPRQAMNREHAASDVLGPTAGAERLA